MPRDDGYASRRELDALRRRLGAMATSMGTATTMARRADAATPTAVRIAMGQTGVAVAIGAGLDVPITWSSPMPKDTYRVDVSPANGLIGRGTTAVKAGSMTAAGLTVTVTASLLVSIGAQFIVVAFC